MNPGDPLLLKIYTILLRMYPRQFRQEFAGEMRAVFGDALSAARASGARGVLRLCSRELVSLPVALAREHAQVRMEKEAGMWRKNRTSHGPVGPAGSPVSAGLQPPASWGEIFMAGLPFLLLLLLDVVPMLLVAAGLMTWELPILRVVMNVIGIAILAAALAVLFFAWRGRWPVWSATWYLLFVMPPILLAAWLAGQTRFGVIDPQDLFFLIFPLSVAVLLYSVTRIDRLRGLLAVLPLLYFLWSSNNMEFVPDSLEASIKITSTVLIYLLIAFLLIRRDWRMGLYAVLLVNLITGALFSFGGIYFGGTLPYSASGPSLVEVLRSLIPQYLATGAILLGPLFAWRFRQAGQAGGRSGRAAYHLALLGLLLVIMVNLLGIVSTMGSIYQVPEDLLNKVLNPVMFIGLAVYLLGLVWMLRTVPPRKTGDWLNSLFLGLLPLAIPIALSMPFLSFTRPVSDLYGIPLVWYAPEALSFSLGLLWLGLSVWLVTRSPHTSPPRSTLAEPEAASSSG